MKVWYMRGKDDPAGDQPTRHALMKLQKILGAFQNISIVGAGKERRKNIMHSNILQNF
jgi:hypothetical protein